MKAEVMWNWGRRNVSLFENSKVVPCLQCANVSITYFIKGSTLIDIREYYGSEGDEKPGKKGISLSVEQVRQSPYPLAATERHFEQWKSLMEASDAINSLL